MRTTVAIGCCAAALLASSPGTVALAQDEAIDEIEVIGITPSDGVDFAINAIPANVQQATAEDLRRSQALDVTEFMSRRFASISSNAAQNNPLQPDIQFRGFTGSPLLGLPQGIAVYQDNVRIMEPFGDTVNWELIPESAIASVSLIGGANPLFGLNTLGGSLVIRTKDGFTHPGYRGELTAGSFGRVTGQVEAGGNDGTFGYFATATYFDEDGWRERSPSDVKNLFATAGWHGEATSVDVGITYGDGSLIGNGPAPVELLAIDRDTIFTSPDITDNEMSMFTLDGTHEFGGGNKLLSFSAFVRALDTNAFNGDGTEFEECDVGGEEILVDEFEDLDGDEECTVADEFEIVEDQNGDIFEDGDMFDAINNTGALKQDSFGGTLQHSFLGDLLGRNNRFIVGLAYQEGEAEFRSGVEVAMLRADRSTAGTGRFVPEEATEVETKTRTRSAYFANVLSVSEAVTLSLAGRFNSVRVRIRDLSGEQPDLNGDHSFNRFNPSVGLTWQATPALNVYGSYSESSRSPTPVELTCADPEAPCNLPNAFLADPPLEQVVSRSVEGGLRGRFDGWPGGEGNGINWYAGFFHTTNDDDIIFQATGGVSANEGFFDNVGDTVRRGVELGADGMLGDTAWYVNYSFVQAEFDDGFTVTSPNHPLAGDDGILTVESGDAIPSIPAHAVKAGADVPVIGRLTIGGDIVYSSGQYLRGDEANLLDETDGYAVVNLRGVYEVNNNLSLIARIENVFDTDYETFGLLGEPDEVLGDGFDDARFLGPGPERGAWVGIRLDLGR